MIEALFSKKINCQNTHPTVIFCVIDFLAAFVIAKFLNLIEICSNKNIKARTLIQLC
jgi:hypothetical protein